MVLLHPDDGSVESWTAEGSSDKMRADFAGWEPRYVLFRAFVLLSVVIRGAEFKSSCLWSRRS